MNWIILAAGLFNLFLGFLVWSRNKSKKLNYLFGLFSLLTAFLCFFDFAFRFAPTLEIVRWSFAIAVILPAVAFLWVYELFNKSLSFLKSLLVLLPSFFFFILSLSTDLIIKEIDFLTILGYRGDVGLFFTYYSLYIFFFSLYVIVRLYYEQKIAVSLKKAQLRFSLIGLIFYSAFASFFSLLLPSFWGIYDLTLLDAPSSLFFVGFSAYAVLRYRLMDIRVVIRKGTVIFTTLLVVVLIFITVIFTVARVINFEVNPLLFSFVILAFSTNILLFIPIKNFLEKYFNKHFFASLYEEEKVLRNLIREIPRVLNIGELINLIVDTTQKVLQIEMISLWSVNAKDKEYVPLKRVGFNTEAKPDIIKNKRLANHFLKYREPLMMQEMDKVLTESCDESCRVDLLKIKDKMISQKIEVVLPLILKKKLIGMIFLGRKIDGAAYSKQDINVLKVISDQSAVALENASLYEETQKFGEKMESEVKKATSKLRKINKQLMKLDKAKSEFISIASHQLRTPLTAIKGYTSMVLDGDYGKVNKSLMPALDRIYSSTKRMGNLVENLLNISRIESGKITFDFKDVKFDELVKGVVSEFYSIVKKKNLELNLDCRNNIPLIKADEIKIKEVVSNLIDNAVKYTDKGSVRVLLKVADEYRNKYLLLSVKDSGMGIAEDDLPNIFQKFRRGKKVALIHTEGLGLGMYFSQKVVEAHKGKIWVESEGEGKGSTFYVMLPIK